jgi:DNA protecting protein DprA
MVAAMDERPADNEELVALLALLEDCQPICKQGPKPTWSTIASEVALRGSAIALWQELQPLVLDGMGSADGALERARATLAEWHDAEIDLVTVLDPRYPLALRAIHQRPPVLFVKGRLLADEVAVSVVGSRTATRGGMSIAATIASGLVECGIAVISGLAAGIDTAAHEATIAAEGRPVGVLGTGINRVYPEANRELHEQVAAAGGLVSQFVPDAPPGKRTFPMRNATMSGLGAASIIVEAGERSGSRILARVSVEHGRAVILTDGVVESTRWGKELRDLPGVHVAGNTAEVLGIVEKVVRESDFRAPVETIAVSHSDPP